MAPEVALDKIEQLTVEGGRVLDPMCGSGTVVSLAAARGRVGFGTDLDPLAVLIARTTCYGWWSRNLEARASEVVRRAQRLGGQLPPWVSSDPETADFVSYWFAPDQAADLSRLARVLAQRPISDDPLRVAFSRMIVTKERGASLARDTSHSRPHRVADDSDFDVFSEYIRSAKKLEALIEGSRTVHRPRIRRADARTLRFVDPGSIDLVVTSPPYLNAIDYLRGHKMSLVWMGWTASALRELRRTSVGVERQLKNVAPEIAEIARAAVPDMDALPNRWQGVVVRFARDMDRLATSLARVTKPKGHLVMVVANSQLKGVPISNAAICVGAAGRHGFDLIDETVRPLPARHRYLPPPAVSSGTLGQRIKEEVVFTFSRK
jgi:hypothetical protein